MLTTKRLTKSLSGHQPWQWWDKTWRFVSTYRITIVNRPGSRWLPKSHASAATYMTSPSSWLLVANLSERLIFSIFEGPTVKHSSLYCLTLENGTVRLSRNVGRNYQSTLRSVPEEGKRQPEICILWTDVKWEWFRTHVGMVHWLLYMWPDTRVTAWYDHHPH